MDFKHHIDINCDLGEYELLSDGTSDAAIMPFISSCNIACGGHAGNELVMQQSVLWAKENQLRIGAHPSFPDRKNFGRLVISISNESLADSLYQQITTLKQISEQHEITLAYVKPHGALYNLAADDTVLAELIIQVIQNIDNELALMGLAHSQMQKTAENAGIEFIAEAFIDRRYTDTKKLQNRSEKGAVLDNEQQILEQALALVQGQSISSNTGKALTIQADSLCFHGDGSGAAKLAIKLAQHLHQHQVSIHA